MRRSALFLFATGMLACQQSHDELSSCDTPVSGYLNGRWNEPVSVPPPREPEIPTEGLLFSMGWAPAAHVLYSTLWLDDDEPIALRLQVAASFSDPRAGSTARVVLFLDGTQLPLRQADEREAPYAEVPIVAGQVTAADIYVSPEHVSDGAHSLAVATLGVKSGHLFTGTLFTVLKAGTAFAARAVNEDVELGDRASTSSATSGAAVLSTFQSVVRPDDGTVPLELVLQHDSEMCQHRDLPIVAVALVDFKQVELDGCGKFCRVMVEANRAARLRSAVHLPVDAEQHVLSILEFFGDGLYAEAPPGQPAPWYWSFVAELGFASFQP